MKSKNLLIKKFYYFLHFITRRISKIHICSICGKLIIYLHINREGNRCKKCESYWRTRAVITALLMYWRKDYKVPLLKTYPDFSLSSVGMSDDVSITRFLPQFTMHTNTSLDSYPKLNLLELKPDQVEICNILICSDVLEHVVNNIELCFINLYRILKPNGLLILSVPLVRVQEKYSSRNIQNSDFLKTGMQEYYPNITEWKHDEITDSILWTDSNNSVHRMKSPEWHGGVGLTLTFRLFSKNYIVRNLNTVGFRHIDEYKHPNEKYNLQDGGIFVASK
jgi:hypothetical protein